MSEVAWFDLETTGVDVSKDRIVQVAIVKGDLTYKTLVNPERPIDPKATEVHGITDEMVADAPVFKDVARRIYDIMIKDGGPIGGFNSNRFDVPLLYEEFARTGFVWDWKRHKFIDAHVMYARLHERTLAAVYEHYVGPVDFEAHDALADVIATQKVFDAMVAKNPQLKEVDLNEFCAYDRERLDLGGKFKKNDAGEIVFAFGKNEGKPVNSHEGKNYLEWMCRSDFPRETINFIMNLAK